ncbi:MAG TPA: SDR family oxidoreductase [Solirubrobacteraceae bacterium]|jgi:NAD(P)-dependent dehydrogenase (short-subunit alcohol dehydrogenase family)|nr:SDR family oxidoreductase [Solirubrobacteraceae bacterium]
MPNRAAIVTGASRGIGRALAEALAADGYELTITARKPETIEEAAEALRASGVSVESVAGNLGDESVVQEVVRVHRERYGRLDVLVNNAGLGIGGGVGEQPTKHVDLMLNVNLRSMILFYRESLELLKAAGEDRGALVVNMASIAGKQPPAWLAVYGATKAAVVAYTRSMNKELNGAGIKSVAFCPGFVDTDMTEFVRGQVDQEDMIKPADIAEALRFMLRLSPACVVPEIIFSRPGEPF